MIFSLKTTEILWLSMLREFTLCCIGYAAFQLMIVSVGRRCILIVAMLLIPFRSKKGLGVLFLVCFIVPVFSKCKN